MILGDIELHAASEVTIPMGVHAGKSLLEVPTSFLFWAMSTPGWRRSNVALVEPILREIRRRLRTPQAVVRELDTPCPGPRRPSRSAKPVPAALNPTPAQRIAVARRKLDRIADRVERSRAEALTVEALTAEARRRGLDLV